MIKKKKENEKEKIRRKSLFGFLKGKIKPFTEKDRREMWGDKRL